MKPLNAITQPVTPSATTDTGRIRLGAAIPAAAHPLTCEAPA